MSDVIVKTTNLTKIFPVKKGIFRRSNGGIYAVHDVNLEIPEGKIFGLIGESGSGKTTIGNLLVRLIEPTRGRIQLNGQDILDLKKSEEIHFRRKVQMIFQDPYESLNPRLTVYETVAEPLIIQEKRSMHGNEKEVLYALESAGLTPPQDFLYRYPHELSGGQRQRVAIARALIIRPKFVVADEPVSMLDVSIRVSVLNLMLELKDKFGLTYLFITHDLSIARYMCDWLIVMYQGKIVESGSTEEVIQHPLHPYTRALISAVPIPDPMVKRRRVELSEAMEDTSKPPLRCRFYPKCETKSPICEREYPGFEDKGHTHFVACHGV